MFEARSGIDAAREESPEGVQRADTRSISAAGAVVVGGGPSEGGQEARMKFE